MDTYIFFYMLESFSNNHHKHKTTKPLLLPRRSCSQRRIFSGLCTYQLGIKNSIKETMPVNRFYSPSSLYVLKSPPLTTAFKPQSVLCGKLPLGQPCSFMDSTNVTWHPATPKVLLFPNTPWPFRLMLLWSLYLACPSTLDKFLFVKLRLNVKCSEHYPSFLHLLLCTYLPSPSVGAPHE